MHVGMQRDCEIIINICFNFTGLPFLAKLVFNKTGIASAT